MLVKPKVDLVNCTVFTLSEAIVAILLNPLLVNLSFLTTKPTGITTYATNLFPHLQPLSQATDFTAITNTPAAVPQIYS